ncbi:methylated-DNA--[protein]-cysteine S-methyltransferase [Anaerococcus sp. Marseille-P3625]|uniref:methylated-DNA--[protein]-cysteine S-methyltransferase n=1 Tax=Anaerococcus sp. Marseille-P3625 TaxID=1977277 RepID=UPI000C0803A3|nr:methylated-DNA--[protein]-cysteine S-methyltransferase [Anaerococcus sp. Marseille-P3625]
MNKKFAFYTSKIGIIKITYGDFLKKIELTDRINEIDQKSTLSDDVFHNLEKYLKGELKSFKAFDIDKLEGTDFQKIVWKELCNIPYGKTKTYKDIAYAINRPKAIRPVATAIGKNPLMILIPCHRVIGSDGKLCGYAYGLSVKKFLIDLEKNNI